MNVRLTLVITTMRSAQNDAPLVRPMCESFRESACKYGYDQAFFPIVQGSCYKDLRQQSAEYIANSDQVGNAIGGLSVGEPAEEMYAMTEVVCEILPEDKPRY
jgi:tRNA-guanine family transglycosylase